MVAADHQVVGEHLVELRAVSVVVLGLVFRGERDHALDRLQVVLHARPAGLCGVQVVDVVQHEVVPDEVFELFVEAAVSELLDVFGLVADEREQQDLAVVLVLVAVGEGVVGPRLHVVTHLASQDELLFEQVVEALQLGVDFVAALVVLDDVFGIRGDATRNTEFWMMCSMICSSPERSR